MSSPQTVTDEPTEKCGERFVAKFPRDSVVCLKSYRTKGRYTLESSAFKPLVHSLRQARMFRLCSVFSTIFLALSFVLILSRSVPASGPIVWESLQLRMTNGDLAPLALADWQVVCFLGTECPLAKLYGPRLQEMSEKFAERGVSFLGVNSNLQDSPAEIDEYAKSLGIEFPIVKDADQKIAEAFNATRTPEVFVVDPRGIVQYQGRIDDQYEPGIARAEPTQHDLFDAITSLVAGEPLAVAKTAGVGCLITRVAPRHHDSSLRSVTFHRDITPILNEHCVECHRHGEIAPFELTDYDEVVGWGQMMLEVIDNGRMPPWHADPNIGHFVGERKMTQSARATIAAWIDAGLPEGNIADRPATPTWPDGWHIPQTPDVEIAMRERPFVVPAGGTVEYQYFVVDPHWTEDRWIRAAQVIPGDASVVHHAIVFVRPPDGSDSRGLGWMGAYVPGQRAAMLPPGHARRIPAGSKLVFQMHYTPAGKIANDITRVGVWFADQKTVTHEVFTSIAINHEFEIPPGAKDFVVDMQLDSFPRNAQMLGATPHMHVRGASFQLVARRGDDHETLLSVPHYDFNWQHWYQFAEPLDLDTIDSLDMSVKFDNSSSNPANPAPQDYVTWGDQTWEEMAIAFFDVAVPLGTKRTPSKKKQVVAPEDIAAKQKAIDKRVQDFLSQLDVDGDGVVTREEAPLTFQKFGFRELDRNDDRVIDRMEVEFHAARRL